MVGAVVSMLIPETVVLFEFLATSNAVPGTLWFVPSLETVTGAVQLAIPDCSPARPFAGFGSVQVKVTVTGALYQLKVFAARSGAPEIVGGVLSMLKPGDVKVARFRA